MKNTISERVADFLKQYPPFSEMSIQDVSSLAQEVTIIYKPKDSMVFDIDETPHANFYVVHKGAIVLSKANDNDVIDLCDEGDIFGLRPLMASENYKLRAKAYEESILYGLPFDEFRPFTRKYESVANFLIESFASNTRNPYSKIYKGKLLGQAPNQAFDTHHSLFDLQYVNYSKKLVTCSRKTTIKDVAETMTKKKVGAILIADRGLPVGIITDKNIRDKVATGEQPITAFAQDIMTSPVITYPKKMTVAQAQMAMMKSGISHLCLTQDGTINTKAVGVLSKHDLMLATGNNPAVLMKAIKRAQKFKTLKQIQRSITNLLKNYLDQNIPVTLTAKIISELNDACVKQVIIIALNDLKTVPPVAFAWLGLGSQGRSEQLLRTDQDNALIFKETSKDKLETTRKYFLNLAKVVNKGLHQIGYEYCPAEMMASNPAWCLSLAEWKNRVSFWITNPGKEEVLLSSIFFDYNVVYGDKALVDALTEHIFSATAKYPLFFLHLASGALQNPSPTGFFRSFLVEPNGAHKDFFDVKRRALMPLIDAARVLTLSHNIKSISNTAGRFERLAELEPNNEELFLACSYATKALIKFRTKQGLLHHDSGRFIALDSLSKEEKIKLKRTFKTIKALQEVIKMRFQVTSILG